MTAEEARLHVRDAVPGDAEDIARMAAALHTFHSDPGGFTPEIILRDGFGPNRWFDILVGEVHGKVAGYALYHRSYETGHAARGLYLADLWVDESARRQGLARALIEALKARALEAGGTYVWLVSQPFNEAARRFYAALGATGEPVHAHALIFEGRQG